MRYHLKSLETIHCEISIQNNTIRLQLITPEELVSPKMDEQSMMTYLSQYPNAKLKQGAPLRPRTNANRFVTSKLNVICINGITLTVNLLQSSSLRSRH